MKPTRRELETDNRWIYRHFYKNGLLDKYCLSKKRGKSLDDAMRAFKAIYGDEKPSRLILRKRHNWIYWHFLKHKIIDKYCLPSTRKTSEQAVVAFKKIYGEDKPTRNVLDRNHHWIYCHFLRHPELLGKYCQPRIR